MSGINDHRRKREGSPDPAIYNNSSSDIKKTLQKPRASPSSALEDLNLSKHSEKDQQHDLYSKEIKKSSTKKSLREGKVAMPPFVVQIENDSNSHANLHYLIEKPNWKKLLRALTVLDEIEKDRDQAIRDILLATNNIGETPLHVASYRAPPRLTLKMLELLPLEQRKDYLLALDDDGNTTLHLACANLDERAEFTVIKNLLLLAPEALEMTNSHGDTPLHLLVSSAAFRRTTTDFAVEAAAEEAITSLLQMVGHLALEPNSDGLCLLHIAIAHGAHERVLVQLLDLEPRVSQMVDERGLLPVHYVAAFGGTPWTLVGKLIWAYPESIVTQTVDGDTPLHLLMSNASKHIKQDRFVDRNTTKLAELLVGSGNTDVCPLMIQNNEHLSPLHCCALFDTPPQLTRILMSSDLAQAASALTTEFGATALHLVCASSKVSESVANVEALATAEACSVMDHNDRTPLVVAVQNKKVSSSVVKALTNAYPEAASIMSPRGFLPLHLALQSAKVRDSIVKALIKAYPESVEVTTNNGNTALHEACRYGASVTVVRMLLEKNRSAVKLANAHGETPLDRAVASKASEDIMSLLKTAAFTNSSFRRLPVQRNVSDFTANFSSAGMHVV